MLWLFAGCLLTLITLFAWKRYEQNRGNYVVLAGVRQATDRRLESMQQSLAKRVRQCVSSSRQALQKVFGSLRLKIAAALRKVADYLER
jgi:hypothetical protein